MEKCRACGGELPAMAAKCPICGLVASTRESSPSSNVIALLVVFVILVIVGSFAMAPEHAVERAKVVAEPASRTAAGTPAKPGHLKENTGPARLSRGLPNASRTGAPLKR